MKLRSLLILLTFALGSSACPAVDHQVVVLRAGDPCLFDPPPRPRRVAWAGPESGCPVAFATCLTVSGAELLEANLDDSRRWQAEAWLRCGPLPDAGTGDAGAK